MTLHVVKDVSEYLIQGNIAFMINCELQIMLLGFRWEDLGMCLKKNISMETNLNEYSAQPRDVSPTAASWKGQNLLPREDSELCLLPAGLWMLLWKSRLLLDRLAGMQIYLLNWTWGSLFFMNLCKFRG